MPTKFNFTPDCSIRKEFWEKNFSNQHYAPMVVMMLMVNNRLFGKVQLQSQLLVPSTPYVSAYLTTKVLRVAKSSETYLSNSCLV